MLGYAAALAWFGAAPLARLTPAGVNARLGLAVWFAAMSSALAVLTVMTLAWRYGRSVHGSRRRASEHAQAARITGRRFPAAGIPALSSAVVLDSAQPAVYCVPGRPATIVLTTGALAVLDEPQLLAVLAHERAHLAGRHHLLVTRWGPAGPATGWPWRGCSSRCPLCPFCSPSSPETAVTSGHRSVRPGCAPTLICGSDYRRQVTVVYDYSIRS